MGVSSDSSGPTSSMAAARQPWFYTQSHPLTTGGFIDEADKRGIKLTDELLRALYDGQLLSPMFAVND